MNGRGGLVWGGERVGMGEGVVRKQENKQDCIMGESTTAYELMFDSNKLQSVYLRGFKGKYSYIRILCVRKEITKCNWYYATIKVSK